MDELKQNWRKQVLGICIGIIVIASNAGSTDEAAANSESKELPVDCGSQERKTCDKEPRDQSITKRDGWSGR